MIQFVGKKEIVRAFMISSFIILMYFIYIYMVENKVYTINRKCLDKTDRCYSILSEEDFALDSPVHQYFYLGKKFWVPLFDDKYVKFDDGVDFCVRPSRNGIILIYADDKPLVNNLADAVSILPWDSSICSTGRN